jgi:mRNA-degrading endonuclease HigB of HigAB toxin-antitoxin module
MKFPRYACLTVIGFVFLLAPAVVSAQKKDNPLKNSYQVIEVANFDAPAETKFPAESVKPLMDEIVSKLVGLKKFKQVVPPGETATDNAAPTLQLVGAITKYEPGSRAKRYVISMGAGKTRVVTHLKYIDKATGQVVFESDASGAVSWGLFGGSSKDSLTGVGKKVAEITKHNFF